jgi:hypothetical protein
MKQQRGDKYTKKVIMAQGDYREKAKNNEW